MKLYILFYFLLSGSVLFAQSNTWHSFYDEETYLFGYKDENGTIKIPPKFTGFTIASKFDNIIAVNEQVSNTWKHYYLTKSGKTVGQDSLFIFDNGSDCESEGFIRFHDKLTDKTGMFNRNGDLVIPARYNGLTRVKNGLTVGLKNAEKKYWDGHNHSGCNHFSWVGGQQVLLDTLNYILIENIDYEDLDNLNFYSLVISPQ